jgi:hypothetical protein
MAKKVAEVVKKVVAPKKEKVVETPKVEDTTQDEFAKRHPGAIPGVIYE